ncbi:MAG TPA: flagellar motor protein MotB [Pirellulales bacterium]|jgi:chemotaxis protein MotB|nr:flagellar motor protein MotB [Pirellulales bacterium]
MAGHGGGAWKVAYADFVTAMMAFFLVMWIVSQDKPVKEAIANYFNNPYGSGMLAGGKSGSLLPNKDGGAIPSPKGPTRSATGHITETAVRMSEDPEDRGRGKSNLQMMHDKNQSAVGTIVPFVGESADLEARGKQVLDELAPDLRGKLTKIEIRGHAAGRPLPPDSPYADTWQLCYARSQAVMNHLLAKGIEPGRLRLSQSGSYEPPRGTRGENLPNLDSRVEIFVLNELINEPVETSRPNREMKPKLPNKPFGIKKTITDPDAN